MGAKASFDLNRFALPWASLVVLALNVAVFFWQRGAESIGVAPYLYEDYTFDWNRFLAAPTDQFPTLISSTFFHSDALHLTGNMLFLFFFAPALERALGAGPFLIIYATSGVAAAFSQAFFSPIGSLMGSSGAVSGVMGAIFVLYPTKVPVGWFRRHFPWTSRIPIFLYIGLWFLWNLRMGLLSLFPAGEASQIGGVAHWAHVGGFAAGAIGAFAGIFRKHN